MYHNLSCLSSIYFFSVRRPISIPSSVKLLSIIKTDPLNRFVLLGDGNIAKVRFNMKTDPDQESLWVAKWRDDIAAYIMKQQWSSPSIGMWYHLLFSHIILYYVMRCDLVEGPLLKLYLPHFWKETSWKMYFTFSVFEHICNTNFKYFQP